MPFSSITLFILDGGSIEGLINIPLSTILLIFLVDWRNFFILFIAGLSCSYALYKQAFININPLTNYDISYWLAYQVICMVVIGILFLRKQKNTYPVKSTMLDRFTGTVLGEQMEFATHATNRLVDHLFFYFKNTNQVWATDSSGFYTMATYGMQTIEDPALYKLIQGLLPVLFAMKKQTKSAVKLLQSSVTSRTIATSLHINKIKACCFEALFELHIHYPSYEYRIYQIVWNEQPKPAFRLVTLQVYDGHIHIKHYTNLLSKIELSSVFAAFPARARSSNASASKDLVDLVNNRIETGTYTAYKLPFPSMEIAA